MKTSPRCLPCFLQQALRVAKLHAASEREQAAVVKAVAGLLPGFDMELSPPEHAIEVYRKMAEVTGYQDPYRSVKDADNRRAHAQLPAARTELAQAAEPLSAAVVLAIAANLIDHGADVRLDGHSAVENHRASSMAIDHRPQLLARLCEIAPGGHVLYLADNCGEIVYDTLVVELLALRGLRVTVAVREAPIINDALVEDATAVGMDRFADIITNGVACPGTPLNRCSARLQALFADADLVIAKGQGNFETLSDAGREVFFLFTVKCPVVAEYLADRVRTARPLFGNGEMVVYRHDANR